MVRTKLVLIVIAEPNGSGKTAAIKTLRAKYPEWTKNLEGVLKKLKSRITASL